MDKIKYYQQSDKGGIILDIGVAYTKVGLVGKNAPTKILKTPPALYEKMKNIDILQLPIQLQNCLKKPEKNKLPTLISSEQSLEKSDHQIQSTQTISSKDSLELQLNQKPNEKKFLPYNDKLRLPLWEFLNQIFYHEILIKPQNKNIYICENYMTPRIIIDILADLLFENFNAAKIFCLLSNSLPLYLTEQNTGIVIECNYQDTQITPIYEGFALMNAHSQCVQTGGFMLNYTLKQQIMKRLTKKDDLLDKETQDSIKKMPYYSLINKYLNFEALEDLKFKYGKIMSRKQKLDFFSTPENIQKMKETLMNFTVNKHQKIPISYFEVMNAFEVLFGDIENEEGNIAYTFLQSILKLEASTIKKTVQNIVFSGGISQIKGFSTRFREELINYLDNYEEFSRIKFIKEHIRFSNIIYPANCLNWIGASIVGCLQNTEKFSISQKQYKENDSKIKDRFGTAYLHANREAPYIAPEIEQADIL